MNNKVEIIQTLLDKIDTSLINLKIIRKNIKFLMNEYRDIKKFYLHAQNYKLLIFLKIVIYIKKHYQLLKIVILIHLVILMLK